MIYIPGTVTEDDELLLQRKVRELEVRVRSAVAKAGWEKRRLREEMRAEAMRRRVRPVFSYADV